MPKQLAWLIFGMQGSGKGTQAVLLSQKFSLCHIAPGDIFRQEIEKKSPLGEQIEQFVTKGLLVPDSITLSVLKEYVQKPACKKGFILDGFPRNKIQQEGLIKLLEQLGIVLSAAMYIDLPAPEVEKRLLGRRICRQCKAVFNVYTNPPQREGVCDQCGGFLEKRSDETAEAIARRIKIYQQETQPLLNYYRQKKLLLEINGNQPIQAVHQEILEKLHVH